VFAKIEGWGARLLGRVVPVVTADAACGPAVDTYYRSCWQCNYRSCWAICRSGCGCQVYYCNP
jgi:hypothetical protein